MTTNARARAGRTAAAPRGRRRSVAQIANGKDWTGMEIGPGLDADEATRIRTVVETLWELQRIGDEAGTLTFADFMAAIMCNSDEGESGRKLAKRLGIPFVLLGLIDAGQHDPTPAELDEFQGWMRNGAREVLPEYTAKGWEE